VGTLPSFGDPKGFIEKLRAGEVPIEGLRWLLAGHDALITETADKLKRIEAGHSPHPFQFIEGPPGSGKSALLHLLRDLAEGQGFATCSIDVTSKGGQFTEQAFLVAYILRNLRVRTEGGVGDLDEILKQFSTRVLEAFPKEDNETLSSQMERLRRFVANRIAKHQIPEKSVIDAAYGYLFAYRRQDPVRMRKVVEWLQGENLTMSEIRGVVGAGTRLDERTALPILKSVLPILVEAGYPGLVLLVDEMVQSMNEHHESQRQRTQEIVRALYAGVLPRSLVFVGATPETIMDAGRGFAAHEGMRSRVGDGTVPDRDPELSRYRLGSLTRTEAAEVLGRICEVYGIVYKLPDAWLGAGEQSIVEGLCPERGVLARDFVAGAVKCLDMNRRKRP
jgi:bacteriophage exclusion system BrxC/D-like protein